TRIIVIGVLALLLYLSNITTPHQDWFQVSFILAVGLLFLSWGLFFHSWFAATLGASNSRLILQFGPAPARVVYLIIGMLFLVVGIVDLQTLLGIM
ncbi:MAG: hypothetical protein ACRDHW_22685, partial [Ktedonobacteraceae bacterium]